MIRIGDFSKLSRIPIQTLRYYDEVGLLKPVQVDPLTGYRYYAYEQLEQLNRILALKDLGFSLEQIRQLLDENLSLEQMRGMLILRRSEIQQKVQEEVERLSRVEARLRQIEEDAKVFPYEVLIQSVPAINVASVRKVVPTPGDQGTLWRELEAYLEGLGVKPAGPCISLYHDEAYKELNWDIEVCEPLANHVKETASVRVRELASVPSMACAIHHGPLDSIGEAYVAVVKWITLNDYHISGPAREVYVQEPKFQEDPEALTEIQFPVDKE